MRAIAITRAQRILSFYRHSSNASFEKVNFILTLSDRYDGIQPETRFFSAVRQAIDSSLPRDTSKMGKYDERMINELIAYKDRHGDCHVPASNSQYAKEERTRLKVSKELAEWVAKQRSQYRRAHSKRGKLTEDLQIRIVILESMGFIWYEREAQWQRSFNRLEAYQKERGSLRVNKKENPQLWNWVDQQRKAYHLRKLSDERYDLLKSIDFIFDAQEASWWEFYEKLCDYKKEHGDTLVPVHSHSDKAVGAWVARQRRLHNIGQLQEDRVQALEDISFSWDVHGDAWESFYEKLNEFYKEHGHTRVPRSSTSLWNWADRQRRKLRDRAEELESAQDSERARALEKMGFSLEEDGQDRVSRLMDLTFQVAIHDETWMENFERLCAFKEKFGHFSIPSDSTSYQELSNWVRHQRFLYNRGTIPKERFDALDGIDFAWTAQAARWDRMYERLVRFNVKHGHTRVPSSEAELYRWINQQRKILQQREDGTDTQGEKDHRLIALEKILSD